MTVVPTIDVDAARAATPTCERAAFLLSAGSSLPTTETLEAQHRHLRREADVGGYAAADEVADELAGCRAELAELVGGTGGAVALSVSDSAAWVKAWWGWVLGGNIPDGSVVLIDRLAYHSHYASLVQTQRVASFQIEVMPTLDDGTVDVEALQISDRVAVVCATMIGTHSGNVNPIGAIGGAAVRAGVPLFVDGCQALGQLDVDVRALGCSVFTGTGRKFLRAPRGTGMVWIADEIVDRFQPPGIDGTSTDWDAVDGLTVRPGIGRFEEYETSYAALVGLAAATRQARALTTAAIEARVVGLGERLRSALTGRERITVRDTAAQRCGIVTFTIDAIEPSAVVSAAAAAGIVINASTATWAALDLHAKGTPSVVRASPHYFNTEAEVDRLVDVVIALVG
jgi:cysteine desulfurase / selenocysteine lyase